MGLIGSRILKQQLRAVKALRRAAEHLVEIEYEDFFLCNDPDAADLVGACEEREESLRRSIDLAKQVEAKYGLDE